jgi:two-component system CheB/CheR fusion protein
MQAFIELLQHLPPKPGLALVLVQHLEPSRESILAEILGRETSIPVVQGRNRQRLEPDHIYIIPPNAYISIVANALKITPRAASVKQRFLPIDYFLSSLAKERGNKAIAVILSGTGADGTQGVKAVHAAGGLTLAQDEKTAQYPEMPASADATRTVDFVLAPAGIAAKLWEIRENEPLEAKPVRKNHASGEGRVLEEIFRLLQKARGVDFSHYKPTTLQRRIKRRMGVHRLRTLQDYFVYLQKHSDEAGLLYQDFLIPVTSFFRDPNYFEFLEKKVYPTLMEQRDSRDTLRVWVPGCSTGEEAYSLAMSLCHYMASRRIQLRIQIFGTDVNEAGIAKARLGNYPAAIAKDIPPAFLTRYFVKTSQGYKIDKGLRDLCMFSRQNVGADPPFSNIDLLSFRNVLIYMDARLQGEVIPLLHFALKPKGFLMLGTSESLSAFAPLFSPLDRRYKIFSRKSVSSREHLPFTAAPIRGEKAGTVKAAARLPEVLSPEKEMDRILIKKYVPAGVLVNNQLDILQFRGHTGAFLEPATGRANLNLLNMVREGLWGDLRKAIDAARRLDTPVKRQAIVIHNTTAQHVTLEVTPVRTVASQGNEKYFFIAFESAPAPAREKNQARGHGPAVRVEKDLSRLRQENYEFKEYVQSLRLELENTSGELKAAREEMQSSNEELQTMNEELETSKEELQSTNEELVTTNEELKNKNADLVQINDDLGNVLSGIELPLVILDTHLRIRRFTASAKNILNVVGSDIGRSISEIKLKVSMPDLERKVSEVIETVRTRILEIGDPQKGWYTLVIKPYKTAEAKIEGVLLVFYDMTRMKENLIYSENIVATLRESVAVLDPDLKIVSANRSFYETFKTKPEETVGHRLYQLGQQQWNIPKLRELLEKIISQNFSVENYEVTLAFPGVGEKTLLLNAKRISPANTRAALILLAIEDITEQHQQAEQELSEENRHKDEFLAMLAHELRNPLWPIQTMLELVRQEPEARNERISKRLESIRRQVVHLAHIVDDLLDVSRISRGLITLKKERVNLAQVIDQAGEVQQPRMDLKRQALIMDVTPEPLWLDADPVRLVQILSNLLENAYKYTPENGRIVLRAQRQGREAVVTVQDTGVGIPLENLTHIFDMFFQSEKGLDRTKGGLGLGLALSRDLAVMHAGTLEAASAGLNQGSLFILRLPLSFEPAANPETEARQEPRTSEKRPPLKVLLVEDNQDAAESMAEVLALWGHEARLALDGPAALQQADAFRPEVVLLDIGLPGMDGYEVATHIRATPELSRIKLVALTGYNPDRSRMDQAGFNNYFTKPVDLDKLEAFLAGLK